MHLQPASIEDIPVGKPLPWNLYDQSGQLVLSKGEIVTSRDQLESLDGLQREGNAAEFREAAPPESFPPRGVKPQIGERIQFRLLNRSSQIHYSSRLIGYIANRSILVTVPLAGGSPLILMDGEQLELRMVTGSNIYVFKTAIQRLCVSPVHYMHLDYPTSMRTQKLRKSPWAKVNLGASVTNAKGDQEIARIVNLSMDGALLHAPQIGKEGDALKISFHAEMDELEATLNLEAKIVRALEKEGEEGMIAYGISFDHPSMDHALWLKALIYKHIAEGGLA